jgi:hypothetical protein
MILLKSNILIVKNLQNSRGVDRSQKRVGPVRSDQSEYSLGPIGQSVRISLSRWSAINKSEIRNPQRSPNRATRVALVLIAVNDTMTFSVRPPVPFLDRF